MRAWARFFMWNGWMQLALAQTAAAESSAHGEQAVDWSSLILPGINFALFAALAVWVYRKKLSSLLAARRTSVIEQLASSGKELAQSKEKLNELKVLLTQFEEEAGRILEASRLEGERMAKALSAKTAEDAKRIDEEAKRQRAKELEGVEKAMRAELIRITLERARREISSALNEQGDRVLRREVVRVFQS